MNVDGLDLFLAPEIYVAAPKQFKMTGFLSVMKWQG